MLLCPSSASTNKYESGVTCFHYIGWDANLHPSDAKLAMVCFFLNLKRVFLFNINWRFVPNKARVLFKFSASNFANISTLRGLKIKWWQSFCCKSIHLVRALGKTKIFCPCICEVEEFWGCSPAGCLWLEREKIFDPPVHFASRKCKFMLMHLRVILKSGAHPHPLSSHALFTSRRPMKFKTCNKATDAHEFNIPGVEYFIHIFLSAASAK